MECFQLGRGRQLGRLDSLDLGSQQIVRETQTATIQKLGATPAAVSTLSFCTVDPAFRFSEHHADDDATVFFMAGGAEFDLRVPAGVQTTYVSFDQETFLRDARVLNPREWEMRPTGIRALHSRLKDRFKAAVDVWFGVAKDAAFSESAPNATPDAELMRKLLLRTVLDIATTATDAETLNVPHGSRTRSLHICRATRAYAEARLETGELPSTADICMAVGVCERTLQYAFRDYAGRTPSAYLRLLRLNRVRSTLAAADPKETTVTKVAMQYGFLHLGRFAQDYRRVFDVSPSATLAA